MKGMLKNIQKLQKFWLCKRGIISEALPWIIISISILAILMIAIFILKEKGTTVIDSIKNLFRF